MTAVFADFSGGTLTYPRNLNPRDIKATKGLSPGTLNVVSDQNGFLMCPKAGTTAYAFQTPGASKPPGSITANLNISWSDGAPNITQLRVLVGATEIVNTLSAGQRYRGGVLVGSIVYAAWIDGAGLISVDRIALGSTGSSYSVTNTYSTTLTLAGGTILGLFHKDSRLIVLASSGTSGDLWVRASGFGDFSSWTILASPTSVSPIDGYFPTNVARAALQVGTDIFVLTDRSIVTIGSAYPQVNAAVNGIMLDTLSEFFMVVPSGVTSKAVAHTKQGLIVCTRRGIETVDIGSGESMLLVDGDSGDMTQIQKGVVVRGALATYYIDDQMSVWRFSSGFYAFGRQLFNGTVTYDLDNEETATGLTATIQTKPLYNSDPSDSLSVSSISVRTSKINDAGGGYNTQSNVLQSKVDASGQSLTYMKVQTDPGQSTEFRYELAPMAMGYRDGQTITVQGPLKGRLLSIKIDVLGQGA